MRLTLIACILSMTAGLAAQEVEITGIAVCRDVQARACQEPVEKVATDTPSLACLITLKAAAATTLKHRWSLDGAVKFEIDLPVKFASPMYRQWSRKNLNGGKGNWTVEIVAPDGSVLKTARFVVE
jgi:hypothetical protein